eukprot:5780200-Pyramimonas_sp.AAC.1
MLQSWGPGTHADSDGGWIAGEEGVEAHPDGGVPPEVQRREQHERSHHEDHHRHQNHVHGRVAIPRAPGDDKAGLHRPRRRPRREVHLQHVHILPSKSKPTSSQRMSTQEAVKRTTTIRLRAKLTV